MSSYMDDFKARMNVNGNSIAESQFNTTASFTESTFADSPFYYVANWNGVDLELRLIDVPPLLRGADKPQQFSVKFAILKPNVVIDLGEIITIENVNWMIVDFTSENKLFPKVKIELCNSTFPIKQNKRKSLIGHDTLGKPVYDEIYEIDTTVPCIVERNNFSTSSDSQLVIPKNNMYISLQYQQSDTLTINYEFNMYNDKYKITDIDYTRVFNEKGIIKMLVERV